MMAADFCQLYSVFAPAVCFKGASKHGRSNFASSSQTTVWQLWTGLAWVFALYWLWLCHMSVLFVFKVFAHSGSALWVVLWHESCAFYPLPLLSSFSPLHACISSYCFRWISVKMVEQSKCQKGVPITDRMLCTRPEVAGEDSCQGMLNTMLHILATSQETGSHWCNTQKTL